MEASWPTKYVSSRRSPQESPIADVLSRLSLFSGIDAQDLLEMSQVTVLRLFPKRASIVHELDSATFVYVILSGVVASHCLLHHKETILSLMQDGTLFGEWSISGVLAPYGAYALTDVTLAMIPTATFDAILDKYPKVAKLFALGIEERFRASHEQTTSIASQDVTSRLAKLLLNLGSQFGTPHAGGVRISLRLTNNEMASMIATSRETINRTLNRFWDEKLVDMRSSHIVLKDLPNLKRLSGYTQVS